MRFVKQRVGNPSYSVEDQGKNALVHAAALAVKMSYLPLLVCGSELLLHSHLVTTTLCAQAATFLQLSLQKLYAHEQLLCSTHTYTVFLLLDARCLLQIRLSRRQRLLENFASNKFFAAPANEQWALGGFTVGHYPRPLGNHAAPSTYMVSHWP
jgi:hypothetical protein